MMADTKLADRLAQMMGMLNSGDKLSVKQLAEKFNTSERTIQRDLTERLSFLDLEKSEAGWRLNTQTIGKLSKQIIQNFAAISGIRDLYPSLNDKFLKTILSTVDESAYLIKPHHYESLSNQLSSQLFSKLENAIAKNEKISFHYKDKEYSDICPYKMVNSRGIWYLASIDAGKLKSFHVSQITLLQTNRGIFVREPLIEEQIKNDETIWFSQNKQKVLLKISAEVAKYFTRRQLLPEQVVEEECDDGSLILSSQVASQKQIIPIIKYWIPHVKIISPEIFKESLKNDLRNYLA